MSCAPSGAVPGASAVLGRPWRDLGGGHRPDLSCLTAHCPVKLLEAGTHRPPELLGCSLSLEAHSAELILEATEEGGFCRKMFFLVSVNVRKMFRPTQPDCTQSASSSLKCPERERHRAGPHAHCSPCSRGHGAESLLFQEGVDLTHNAHTLSHIWGSAQGPGCHLHQVAWLTHVPITSDTVSRSVTSLLQGEQTPWALPLVLW